MGPRTAGAVIRPMARRAPWRAKDEPAKDARSVQAHEPVRDRGRWMAMPCSRSGRPSLLSVGSLIGVLAALVVAIPASAALPNRGDLVLGKNLGGVRIGMTKAQVLESWGHRHGV